MIGEILGLYGLFQRKRRRAMVAYELPLGRNVNAHRRLAYALAWHAVGGEAGRPQYDDPVYEDVTLGLQNDARDQGWFFSSCAFLPHWIYEQLGLDEVPKIGRSRTADQPLSRLAWNPLAEAITPDTELLTGDTVQIGSNGDSHVMVVREYTPPSNGQPGVLESFDYGQPGAALRRREVTRSGNQLLVHQPDMHSRPLRRRLDLAALVAAAPTVPESLAVGPELAALWKEVPPELPGVGAPPDAPKAPTSSKAEPISTAPGAPGGAALLGLLILGGAGLLLAARRSKR